MASKSTSVIISFYKCAHLPDPRFFQSTGSVSLLLPSSPPPMPAVPVMVPGSERLLRKCFPPWEWVWVIVPQKWHNTVLSETSAYEERAQEPVVTWQGACERKGQLSETCWERKRHRVRHSGLTTHKLNSPASLFPWEQGKHPSRLPFPRKNTYPTSVSIYSNLYTSLREVRELWEPGCHCSQVPTGSCHGSS